MSKTELQRRKNVYAMEMIMRHLNDECQLDRWLMCGVADGDIDEDTNLLDSIFDWYVEEENYNELAHLFLNILGDATDDNDGEWKGLFYN